MSRQWIGWVLWVLAAAVAQGCGSAKTELDPALASGDASNGDPSAPAGSTCAKDSDCASAQKCSETHQCIGVLQCNTDADCSGSYQRFCIAEAHSCQPCRGLEGCPADKPVCMAAAEGGLVCAECAIGDSSNCATGSWCSNDQWPRPPACTPADCESDRKGAGCTACITEHAQLCYGPSGACSELRSELTACMAAASGDAAAETCPVDRIPTVLGCVPTQCQDGARALEACLYECQAALTSCLTP